MTPHPLRVAVIIGSTRQGRFAPTVARWFTSVASSHHGNLTLDVIDLVEAGLPDVLSAEVDEATLAYTERVDAADAFVVVTPEYNHAYPAPLKQAIDLVRSGWSAKPVAFVSYGGISGGLRAVEQLRPVFAELHAVTLRDTVSFHDITRQFDGSGAPVRAAAVNRAATALLDRLIWWAEALRQARLEHPYAA